MISQAQVYEKKLIEEVWGGCCIECDCSEKPNLKFLNLKNEDIAVLSCPECDFTIVVIELEKLYDTNFKNEFNKNENNLIATYPSQ